MIQDGIVEDPNYVLEPNGKLTFLRGSKRVKSVEEDGTVTKRIQPTISDSRKRRIRRRKERSESEDEAPETEEEEDEEDEEEDSVSQPAKKSEFLLNMIDAMTRKPMPNPAISPFGHVLDYSTWLRLLKETPQNTCPFTKQKLTRRDLVKLNTENLEEYKPKIVTVSFDVDMQDGNNSDNMEDLEQDIGQGKSIAI